MHILNEMDLKSQIAKSNLYPIYFIFGDEQYLIKHYVKKMAQKTVKINRDFNLNEFDSDINVQDVFDAANSLPFMSDKKCVSVCDLNIEKISSAEFEKLLNIVSNPSSSTCLVLWFEVVELNVKKLTVKSKKIMNAIEKSGGCIVNIERKSTNDLIHMLCDGAIKRNCHLEPTTARYMIESCSDDLSTLVNELEKLCAYSKNGLITNKEVDEICPRSVEVSVFNLSKALIAQNLNTAYKILDDLFFMRTEPVIILSILSSAYIDMYRAKVAVECGLRAESVASDLGYNARMSFKLTNGERDSRRLSCHQLELSLCELLGCDKQLKSSKMDSRTLLESLMATLVYISAKGVSV